MRKILIVTVAASVVLAGCAKSSEDVVAQYQSPARYKNLTCDELSMELERVQASVLQLSDEQDNAATRDKVAMGVGLVLFWPALFILAAGDEKEELARLKGEYETLDTVYAQKDCVNAPTTVLASADTPDLGTYEPLPAGTPAPYEGVRLASFSESDMAWFCRQDWERRVSPTGRTEFNPCQAPEVFLR